MVNEQLPTFEDIRDVLISRVGEIKKLRNVSDRKIEHEAQLPPRVLARLRAGEGASYDTLKRLSDWTATQLVEIRSFADSFSIQEAAVKSTEDAH